MHTVIDNMLSKYDITDNDSRKNALKEVVQEVVLCGLDRAEFFNKAAFYGGTALRIFYGLDRFSEDLDFSLDAPDPDFDITKYFGVLSDELYSLGLKFDVVEKVKTKESNIKSAFVKGNTKANVLTFYEDASGYSATELLKIKFEVDTNPPPHANYEIKYRQSPSPYKVRLYDLPSLFAGKLHAVICRAWQNRVKGRDLYDYLFYVKNGAKVNLEHLRARLIDSGYMMDEDIFDIDVLHDKLRKKFKTIDYNSAINDVRAFVKDYRSLDIWCYEYFESTIDSVIAD